MIDCHSTKPALSRDGAILVARCDEPGGLCTLRVDAVRAAMREAGPLARSLHRVAVIAGGEGGRRRSGLPMAARAG